MGRIKDFLEVSKIALRESIAKLSKAYLVLLFILINTIFENNQFSLGLVGTALGGIISYIIGVIITCFVIQCLTSVVRFGNTGKKSVENSLGNFFGPVVSTRFALYLIEILIQILLVNFPLSFRLALSFVVNVFFSAVYEEIYINNIQGFDAIKESIIFIKNNILTYGLYSIIFIGLELFLSSRLGVRGYIGADKILAYIIISIIHTFYLIFRGHLFKYLNEHSYRQRKFMRGDV